MKKNCLRFFGVLCKQATYTSNLRGVHRQYSEGQSISDSNHEPAQQYHPDFCSAHQANVARDPRYGSQDEAVLSADSIDEVGRWIVCWKKIVESIWSKSYMYPLSNKNKSNLSWQFCPGLEPGTSAQPSQCLNRKISNEIRNTSL